MEEQRLLQLVVKYNKNNSACHALPALCCTILCAHDVFHCIALCWVVWAASPCARVPACRH